HDTEAGPNSGHRTVPPGLDLAARRRIHTVKGGRHLPLPGHRGLREAAVFGGRRPAQGSRAVHLGPQLSPGPATAELREHAPRDPAAECQINGGLLIPNAPPPRATRSPPRRLAVAPPLEKRLSVPREERPRDQCAVSIPSIRSTRKDCGRIRFRPRRPARFP